MSEKKEEKLHTIHIRHLKDETYELLYNMKKYYKVNSWDKLLDEITAEFAERIEKKDWV